MTAKTKNIILAVIGGLVSFFALCLFFNTKFKDSYVKKSFKIEGNTLQIGKTFFNTEHIVGILLGICILLFAIAPIIIKEINKSKKIQCFSIIAAGALVFMTNLIIFFYNSDEFDAALDDNYYRFFGTIVGAVIIVYGVISLLLVQKGNED